MNPESQVRPYPNRRTLLQTAATAALATPLLAGCVTAGDKKDDAVAGAAKTADNPLGVKADAPLEVVVFKGGYGDEYATKAEAQYTQKYPKAKVDHKGLQKVGEAMQPRFVGGNPPDVVDNTGAGRLDIATLVNAKQVADLTDLLDAPALDQDGKKVRDTLLPGVVDDGTFGGSIVALNFTYTVWGLWYSKPFFAQREWAYPKTWDEMVALCETIKKDGVAPWTYQGKYPEYINDPLLSMAAKIGGADLVKAVDNLQPAPGSRTGLIQAATAFAELAGKGYIMSGSEALSHTEAQAAWCQKKAAFIPCGSWLESEQKGVAPAGLRHGDGPGSLSHFVGPAAGHRGRGGQQRVVRGAGQGEEPQGGMEYLRILFARASARSFAQANNTLPAVAGATDGLTLSSGLGSVRDAITAAGQDTFIYRFRTWYAPLAKAVDDATGELVNKRLTPADWATRIQKAADALAKDATVTKYSR